MAADVKQLAVSRQSAVWSKWLVFAVAVLVTKSVVKAVAGVVATGANLSDSQRGVIRELYRM
jgi:uncharacterized membrane protein